MYTIVKELSRHGQLIKSATLLQTSNRKVAVVRLHWLFVNQIRRWINDPPGKINKGFNPKDYSYYCMNKLRDELLVVRLKE